MQRAHGGSDSGDEAGKAAKILPVHTSIMSPAAASPANSDGKPAAAFIQPRSAEPNAMPRRINAA
jgi:hypothetical protein